MKKINIQVQSMYPTPLILITTKIFAKALKNGVKNEVSLTDHFYGLAGVYHQYNK